MKRIYQRLLPLLLVLWLLAGTAAAADKAELPICFRQGDQFYSVAILDEWPSTLTAKLRTAQQSLPAQAGPKRLSDSGLPVTYLFLVDCSGSMKNVTGQVSSFAAALEEADDTGARFLLATFGESFSLLWEGQAGEGGIAEEVGNISYTDQKTDLSQGVLDAVAYLKNSPHGEGELLNLVVITDGIPDQAGGSPPLSEAAQQLAGEKAVLTHTFGLRTADSASRQALKDLEDLGQGAHLVSRSEQDAAPRGEELAAFVNDLCATSFAWSAQYDSEVELCFTWENDGEQRIPLNMDNVPVLASREAGSGGENSVSPGEVDKPETPGEPEDSENPETPGAPGSIDSETDQTGNSEHSDGSAGDDSDDTHSKKDTTPDTPKCGWIIWVAGGALIALVLVAVLLLLLRRKSKAAAEPPKGSIFMRMEVITGSYAGPEVLYLTDELIVGRGGRCDIRWKDKEVSPRNSRIFRRDSMVCIEDLGSQYGTALGGMRLHSLNRLRSGDEISIGPVRFRLKF